MGLSTGSWILLGLMASVASLASANTFLASRVGQIYDGSPNGGFDSPSGGNYNNRNNINNIITTGFDSPSGGNYNNRNNINNVIISGESIIMQVNGRDFLFGRSGEGSSITGSHGRRVRIINGGLELTENGKIRMFPVKTNQKETGFIDGRPVQAEYFNGNIVLELPDHTVVAKVGNRPFLGDRYSFENRDQLEAEARKGGQSVQKGFFQNFWDNFWF